mgnify:CR=1 FL=1
MIKRFPGVVVFLIAALSLSAGLAAGAGTESLHEELEVAQEFRKLGFNAYALDHLRRTRERDFLPADVRINATKLLARTYRDLGEAAANSRDFEAKRDNYARAIDEYGRFLKEATDDILPKRERHRLLYERGTLCAELGRDAVTGMKGTAEEEESKEYRATAIEWFDEAVDDLKKATNFFVTLRATVDEGAESDSEKALLRDIREETGRVQMAYGKALYDYAEIFSGTTEEEEQKTHDRLLKDALAVFENITEEYRIFAIRYKAYRHMGMCHRELGSFEKSVEFLDKALAVERARATEWIIRRARLNLAQTYNEWGKKDPAKYEKADIAAAALTNEVYDRAMVTADPALVDMLYAAWLVKGEAQVGHAQLLMKKAQQAEKQGKRVLANQRRTQARRQFRSAVDSAKEISGRPDSRWARNAKTRLDEWLDLSEELFGERIAVRKDITTYTSEGWRLFEEKKYLECIERFQKAVEVGNPAVYGKTLIPESLYQMGLAYYKLSSPGHTQGKYNYYYEAALCFSRIVEHPTYSKADFASDAGYYGMQLYGALFNQTRKRLEGGEPMEEAKKFDGRRYYRSLQSFSRRFADDPRASGTIFQSAEVARALEQYGDASEIYATIKQEHPSYYEAKYRAGLCLYLQALKLYGQEDPEMERIAALLDDASGRYQDFIDWYDDNKDWLAGEQLQEVNRWIVETKISLGKLLVHRAWADARDAAQGAERALAVLEGIEGEHLTGSARSDLRAKFLPQAFFVTIQAYRRLDQLRQAEDFVDQLVERFGQHELSARAARFLGYAYLQRRQNLDDEGANETEIRLAARAAGKYLRKALELQPDQTLGFYNSTAAQLYEMEEYNETIRILEAGLERFPIEEGEKPKDTQLAALGGIKDAYRELEKWTMVQQTVERLLDIEDRLNEIRENQGQQPFKNVNYRRDYALALEKQNNWEDARKYWREAKGLSENMEGEAGRRLKFNSTLHLARCYAQMGGKKNVEHGYKVIAWYLLSNDDWLRNEQWAGQVKDLFANHFSHKFSDLGEFIIQLVEADINLLRQRTSRQAILDVKDRLVQKHQDRIDALIEKARVGLGTGE